MSIGIHLQASPLDTPPASLSHIRNFFIFATGYSDIFQSLSSPHTPWRRASHRSWVCLTPPSRHRPSKMTLPSPTFSTFSTLRLGCAVFAHVGCPLGRAPGQRSVDCTGVQRCTQATLVFDRGSYDVRGEAGGRG